MSSRLPGANGRSRSRPSAPPPTFLGTCPPRVFPTLPQVRRPLSSAEFPAPGFPASLSPLRLLPFAPCQLRKPLRIRRPVLERSCCRAPFPAFRAVPVYPRLREPASAAFRPLAFGALRAFVWAQAAARPEGQARVGGARTRSRVRSGPGLARRAPKPPGARRAFRKERSARSRLRLLPIDLGSGRSSRILACPAGQPFT